MTSEDRLAEYCGFLELQGSRVVRTSCTLWIEARRGCFQPAPPFHLDPGQPEEAREALRLGRGLLGRWFSAVAAPTPPAEASGDCTLYLLRPPYDLYRIQSKARNQTRRGLERLQVRRARFDEALAGEAALVYADNVARLGLFRSQAQLRRRWEQWKRVLSECPCVEFWGVWSAEHLVAFAVVAHSPWGAEIVCQRSLGRALELYPNNALVHQLACDLFSRGVKLISYGLARFGQGNASLDHFKRGMGFEEVHLREHYCFHPRLRLLDVFLRPRLLQRAAHLMGRS